MQDHTTTAGWAHDVQIPSLQKSNKKYVSSAPLKYAASKTFVPFGSSKEAVLAAEADVMVALDAFDEIDENIVDDLAFRPTVQNERKLDSKYLILA
jgi:hypothetical protein